MFLLYFKWEIVPSFPIHVFWVGNKTSSKNSSESISSFDSDLINFCLENISKPLLFWLKNHSSGHKRSSVLKLQVMNALENLLFISYKMMKIFRSVRKDFRLGSLNKFCTFCKFSKKNCSPVTKTAYWNTASKLLRSCCYYYEPFDKLFRLTLKIFPILFFVLTAPYMRTCKK